MILGHLTVTAAAHRLLRKPLPGAASLPLGALLLGAYLPDLSDKSINLLTGLSGRGYGHSLVVQLVCFGLIFLLLPRRRVSCAALGLGAALHLVQDWVAPAVLLAPLLGLVPPGPRFSFVQSMMNFYGGGGVPVWIELAAAGFWLLQAARWWRRRSAAAPPRPAAEEAVAYAE